MKEGTLKISFGSELTISLPATWRYKHYSPEEVQEDVDMVVKSLGGLFGYLEEESEEA